MAFATRMAVYMYEYGRKGKETFRMHPCEDGKRTTEFELFDQYKDGKDSTNREIFHVVNGHPIPSNEGSRKQDRK